MPRYVMLVDFTDQGIRSFKETLDRYDSNQEQFEQLGISIDVYWTLGEYDMVGVMDAPDDETATAWLLTLGSQGTVRTKTMRAFSPDEMRAVIDKAP